MAVTKKKNKPVAVNREASRKTLGSILADAVYPTHTFCAIIGIHRETLAKWKREGLKVRSHNRTPVILGSDYIEWLKRDEVPSVGTTQPSP